MVVFVLFTIGSSVLLGVPAALLLNRQTNAQLQALIDQSVQTTAALYDSQIIQLKSQATLLAGRPTLNAMVFEPVNSQALDQYLEEFLVNADLDAIIVCQKGIPLAATGAQVDPVLCGDVDNAALQTFESGAWLVAAAPLVEKDFSEFKIVVGQSVARVLAEFRDQTRMDYWLISESGSTIAQTFDGLELSVENFEGNLSNYETLQVQDGSYMLVEVRPGELPGYRLIGLFDIEPSLARMRQFRSLILIVLAGVSLLGAILAVLVSRRISKPLNQLARSAASLREGDLETPFTTPSDVWEINELSNALEDARVSLKHSLDQLRVEKLWIENLMNSMVEGLLTVDDHGRITFASESIERIINLDLSLILGKHLDEIFVPPQGEEKFSQQIPGKNQARRIPVLIKDQEVLLSVSTSAVVPAEAGNATKALMIRDVTNEERIHRLLGEFMANITHEFRTPLSALAASVELLVDELPNLSIEEIGQLLNALNIGIIDLQSLIDNLIEAASIEAGRFNVVPREVELSAILKDAMNTIQPLLLKRGLRFQKPKSMPSFLVRADHRRTVQALINLLSNAVKHSPEGGTILLRTLLMAEEVVLEIQDEGEGVQTEHQDQLFKRFASPDSQDLSTMGLGLGLSVVKAVVEAQGGRVGYRNHESGGAIFWFTLPMVTEAES